MTVFTGDKSSSQALALRSGEDQYAQPQYDRGRNEDLSHAGLHVPGIETPRIRQQILPRSEMAREIWEPRVKELMSIPLINPGVSREGIAVPLQHHLEINRSVMFIQVDANSAGVPIEMLQRIYTQALMNQALGIDGSICIIGLSTTDSGLSLAERERLNRSSFTTLRLVESLGLNIQGILAVDLMHTPQFNHAKEALAPFQDRTFGRAFEEACMILASQMIWDCKAVGGWSSFPNREKFELTKAGLVQTPFARGCSLNSYSVLVEFDPTLFALVATQAGRSLTGTSAPAHPDFAQLSNHYGGQTDHGRILLSSRDPEALHARLLDPFELATPRLQKDQISFQNHVAQIIELVRQVHPERIVQPKAELADFQVTCQVLKSWRTEAERDPQNAVLQQMLHQAALAAAVARNAVIIPQIQSLQEQFAPILSGISPRGTLDRVDVPRVDDSSFSDRDSRSPKRGTTSLNTQFNRLRSSGAAPLLPEEKVLVAAEVGDSSDSGDAGDDEKAFTA